MARVALIIGAGGQLGQQVSKVFMSRQWLTVGADTQTVTGLSRWVSLDRRAEPEEHARQLTSAAMEAAGSAKLAAVINVAGGFAMGSAADASVARRTKEMIESSVYTSVVAAHVASQVLRPGGLLVLPGAAAALGPTAWSLPYGTAKAAVHHLVRSLADPSSAELPEGVKTIGIAPQTLDTPQNRAAMPDADTSSWATLEEVSQQLEAWSADPSDLQSGMVYIIRKTAGNAAVFEPSPPL
mmetsp:Transcript_60940/g.132179  ORF Transcript_60940/g.132179 Transcript_60940/m.132179 type:complete len:240 (-) Transcript_60940:158-877(-)|eukprot:CAMPEP_0170603464 /NCGR_PEP_ID=MMETSP0224-20130122/18925_1 /TAXON_ID=285029 /ORGANISM="Togula jolla, Strain CCCM 725" /LENGTH=239 /DNA_ID=CAMNT_0010928345 /DNA_START=56 /DNA_END=775 /DNA_ORIENTATION=-